MISNPAFSRALIVCKIPNQGQRQRHDCHCQPVETAESRSWPPLTLPCPPNMGCLKLLAEDNSPRMLRCINSLITWAFCFFATIGMDNESSISCCRKTLLTSTLCTHLFRGTACGIGPMPLWLMLCKNDKKKNVSYS